MRGPWSSRLDFHFPQALLLLGSREAARTDLQATDRAEPNLAAARQVYR